MNNENIVLTFEDSRHYPAVNTNLILIFFKLQMKDPIKEIVRKPSLFLHIFAPPLPSLL